MTPILLSHCWKSSCATLLISTDDYCSTRYTYSWRITILNVSCNWARKSCFFSHQSVSHLLCIMYIYTSELNCWLCFFLGRNLFLFFLFLFILWVDLFNHVNIVNIFLFYWLNFWFILCRTLKKKNGSFSSRHLRSGFCFILVFCTISKLGIIGSVEVRLYASTS